MGVKTLYEYFYKLAYGDKGADKATLVNDCLDVADAEIKANKDAKHSHDNKTELDELTDGDHDVRTDNPHSVTKTQVSLGNVENLKVKLDATSAPGVSNDNTEGYAVGSRWVDVNNDKGYICLDASTGAAVWTETTGDGAVDTSGTPVDNDFAKFTDADTIEGRSYSETMKDLNPITTKTGTATLTVNEAGTVLVSAAGAYTLTLPTASGNAGLTYHFIKTDANYNLITLEGYGAETFNYENSTGTPNLTYLRLNTYCAEVTIVSDGSNWQCINEKLGQVPECYVYLGTTQENLTDVTWITVLLDNESIDIGSNFASNKFVAPIPGRYHIFGQINYTSVIADKQYNIGLWDGASYYNICLMQSSLAADIFSFTQARVTLSKDDEIYLRVLVDVGVNTVDIVSGIKNTFMMIRLVSKD